MTEKLMTREEIENQLGFLQVPSLPPDGEDHWVVPFLRTALALYDRVAAAQERVEELEAALKSGVLRRGTPRRAKPPIFKRGADASPLEPIMLEEARASVALDKNENGSDVTQCDEEAPGGEQS